MESHNDVIHQMEKIRYTFQHALYISTEQENVNTHDYLERVDLQFRAVAYEGIAMGLALKDLASANLQQWRTFMRSSDPNYLPHVHVGLGWAVAKQQVPSLSFLDSLDPQMFFRVADGHGYYDGIFRSSKTFQNKTRASAIEAKDFNAYDQGLGRSIWYSSKGDDKKVADVIAEFDEVRQPDLWRGIGIACSYVGGCDVKMLEALYTQASLHARHLAIGAAFTARARVVTKSLKDDVELACKVWSNMSAREAMHLTVDAEPTNVNTSDGRYYSKWVSQIESEFLAISNAKN